MMSLINQMIWKRIQLGTSYDGYSNAGTVGLILALLLVAWHIWRMRMHVKVIKAIPIIVIGFYFMINCHSIILSLYSQQSRGNIAVSFVYMPLLAWPLAKLFRMSWNAVSEMFALLMLAYHIPGRSGCIFTGCCHGYPCEWGIYSAVAQDYVFPVQILESLMTLAILIFLLMRICKKEYVPDGKTMPWALFLYGVGRFYTEFLRDNEKIWIGCSDIAFHALFMAVVGYVMLYILFYKQAKKNKTLVVENLP